MKNIKEPVEHIRHSLSHLLAAAVLELYPDAKPTLGPATDDGFYYDFKFTGALTEAELPKIEKKMREMLKSWDKFENKEVSGEQARELYAKNPFKLELIDDIMEKKEPVTLYTAGNFTDLCRGGHVESTKNIDQKSFKLHRLAGAYWRGNEKNPMLTRIYGLAFSNKTELDAHLAMLEEAKKRDHKILGPKLDLFTFSDLVGTGLPLWTPKGTLLRNVLDDFVWELRRQRGYEKVEIPHITKKDLYEKSGHWEKFKDELFRVTTREGHEFAIKPMNCPHHTQIYARKPWSYRELPQRYANTTVCYRDEQTGELSGLARVRAFAQDDAHVFCREDQVKEEFLKIWDIVHEFYEAFGFKLKVRLSMHDPNFPDRYLGDKKRWERAEKILKEIVDSKTTDYFEGLGEAAFYGPKLDFMAFDSIGRQWQVATIQLDMNMPDRFDLTCVNERGEQERIVMIHAAIMGSIERFISILIEHTSGAFPLWLSPIQVLILPVSEKFTKYAYSTAEKIRQNGIRAELDDRNESVGKKIRDSETHKVPLTVVVGEKEQGEGTVTIRKRGGKDQVTQNLEEFIKETSDQIQNRI